MESTGEMETALKFYNQAADPLSLVRVYCYCGNIEKASYHFKLHILNYVMIFSVINS